MGDISTLTPACGDPDRDGSCEHKFWGPEVVDEVVFGFEPVSNNSKSASSLAVVFGFAFAVVVASELTVVVGPIEVVEEVVSNGFESVSVPGLSHRSRSRPCNASLSTRKQCRTSFH